jgi:hypothetical protein
VGHINVASGFGPFPEIFDYILQEKQPQRIMPYVMIFIVQICHLALVLSFFKFACYLAGVLF